MASLDEYRNLNINEIGTWPWPARLGILLLIVILINVAAYFLFWEEEITNHDNKAAEETQLQEKYKELKQKAVNLDAYKLQLKEIRQSLSELLKQLPKRSEMDALLTDINQAGVGQGLVFVEFKPQAETKTNEMAELPINLSMKGNYHSFARFANDIAKLPRIVNLNNIQMTAANDGNISIQTVAKTFRYLDDSELEAMRNNQNKGANKP